MSSNDYKYVILPILVVLFIFVYLSYNDENNESMVNIPKIEGPIKWKRDATCGTIMGKTLKNTIDSNDMNETQDDDWNVYFPCGYNYIDREINKVNPSSLKPDQRLFIIKNADQLSNKQKIWENLVKIYGRGIASEVMPTTYVLGSDKDMARFLNEYHQNKIYILKKNIQRQKGLKISKDKDEIMKSKYDGYVICQEMLQNPYLIDGRKINMRVYLLFVCQNNDVSAYIYNDGFMYYTKEPFRKNSTEDGPNITTGYLDDRGVYERNPLTQQDFRRYLDNPHAYGRQLSKYEEQLIANYNYNKKLSDIVFWRIQHLMRKIVMAVKHTVCQGSHIQNNITFQLFGADIALSDKLVPQLIEINKGPDMGAKDGRDGELKRNVMNDIFKILKMTGNDTTHSFIKVYEDP